MKLACRECEYRLIASKSIIFINDNDRLHCLMCEMKCNECRMLNEYMIFVKPKTYTPTEVVEEDGFFVIYAHGASKKVSLNALEQYIFFKESRFHLRTQLENNMKSENKISDKEILDTLKTGMHNFYRDRLARKLKNEAIAV